MEYFYVRLICFDYFNIRSKIWSCLESLPSELPVKSLLRTDELGTVSFLKSSGRDASINYLIQGGRYEFANKS